MQNSIDFTAKIFYWISMAESIWLIFLTVHIDVSNFMWVFTKLKMPFDRQTFFLSVLLLHSICQNVRNTRIALIQTQFWIIIQNFCIQINRIYSEWRKLVLKSIVYNVAHLVPKGIKDLQNLEKEILHHLTVRKYECKLRSEQYLSSC